MGSCYFTSTKIEKGTGYDSSFIVGPKGGLLIQLGKEPAVEVVDVPIGIVEDKFHSNPLGWMGWGYRRQKVYDRYFTEK